jgi:hypothetical protein
MSDIGPGDKVECINDRMEGADFFWADIGIRFGDIYTVEEVGVFEGYPYLALVGIAPTPHPHIDGSAWRGYGVELFRPLRRPPTFARPVKAKVDA